MPKKYLCSSDALLQRTLKGQGLTAINGIVDLLKSRKNEKSCD
jgi:DNA/RNA-binding domain of Phe-tRNA-synthetase-like protein